MGSHKLIITKTERIIKIIDYKLTFITALSEIPSKISTESRTQCRKEKQQTDWHQLSARKRKCDPVLCLSESCQFPKLLDLYLTTGFENS